MIKWKYHGASRMHIPSIVDGPARQSRVVHQHIYRYMKIMRTTPSFHDSRSDIRFPVPREQVDARDERARVTTVPSTLTVSIWRATIFSGRDAAAQSDTAKL